MGEDKIVFYIIALVIWVISRIAGRNKDKETPKRPRPQQQPQQPKQERTATNPTPSDEMSLEDMIRALRGETPEPKPAKPKAKPEQTRELKLDLIAKHEPKPVEKEAIKQPKYVNLEELAMKDNDHVALAHEDYDDGITFHFANEDDEMEEVPFNARQAVVYDAIMNRPKY